MQYRFKRHDPHIIPRPTHAPGQPDRPRVALEIVRGRAENYHRMINTPAFLIGSAVDCDLVLSEAAFPEVYAYLMITTERVAIRHLGFVPQLLVNGLPVIKADLVDQDEIEMGSYVLRVHIKTGKAGIKQRTVNRCFPEASNEESSLEIRQRVAALIEDIRETFFSDMHHLKLYVESKSGTPRESRIVRSKP